MHASSSVAMRCGPVGALVGFDADARSEFSYSKPTEERQSLDI
jgi:hypothetical protein